MPLHLTTNDIGSTVAAYQSSTKVINTVSDLPAASGGKHTLSANTKYIFAASINIGTNYIECSDNTSLEGVTGFIAQIIYTGTGGAIRGTDVTVGLDSLTIVPAVAGGSCWNFVNAAKTKTIYIRECIVSSQNTAGVIDGYNIQFVETCNFVSTSNGLEFKNGNYVYLVSVGFDATNSGTFVSIPTGSYLGGQINNCTFNVTTGNTAFNLNSATTFSSILLVQGNIFMGAGTHTTGHSVGSYYDVDYKGNSGVSNSVSLGSMYWSNNSGTMTLDSAEGFKKITGGTSIAGTLSRFSHTSPNRLTYDGKKTISAKINLAMAADYQTGGAFVSAIAIAKNGSVIAESENGFTIYSAEEPCSTSVTTTLSQTDYIEAFIKKFTGASTTIKVPFLNVQVNELS